MGGNAHPPQEGPESRHPDGPGRPKKTKERPPSSFALYAILGVGLLLIVLNMVFGTQRAEELEFGDFEAGLLTDVYNKSNVHELTFYPDAIYFQNLPASEPAVSLVDGLPEPAADIKAGDAPALKRYRVGTYGLPDEAINELRLLARSRDILVRGGRQPTDWAPAATFLFMATLVFVTIMMFRRLGGAGSAMSFGRSRGKLFVDDDIGVTFKQIAGIDEAVEELREVVEFLRKPEKYQVLGGRIPLGVLLVGPPGTGKTLLAKAVAGEANVPFFSLSGSDFVEMFVGVGAARVRDMFQQAVAKAPAIIFIDELDALGKARSSGSPGGHDEREQTLNALLVEMDGFSSDESVIVMGATNRPETLDPALMRPGRFDRHVLVDRPDVRGREAILKVHATKIKMADNVDLGRLAKLTPGFVGADLANLVNEAALLAARNDRTSVSMKEFEEGLERVIAGLEKSSRIIHQDEKQRVAYHEMGHAARRLLFAARRSRA
ncbi:MAG: AAA family ATPase [Planctomycetaceae bacterium]